MDKYAPHSFMSLLSDERTNRQVAAWVKDWDVCVFGRQQQVRAPPLQRARASGR